MLTSAWAQYESVLFAPEAIFISGSEQSWWLYHLRALLKSALQQTLYEVSVYLDTRIGCCKILIWNKRTWLIFIVQLVFYRMRHDNSVCHGIKVLTPCLAKSTFLSVKNLLMDLVFSLFGSVIALWDDVESIDLLFWTSEECKIY